MSSDTAVAVPQGGGRGGDPGVVARFEAKVIIVILMLFSVMAWSVMGFKAVQMHRAKKLNQFFTAEFKAQKTVLDMFDRRIQAEDRPAPEDGTSQPDDDAVIALSTIVGSQLARDAEQRREYDAFEQPPGVVIDPVLEPSIAFCVR